MSMQDDRAGDMGRLIGWLKVHHAAAT